MSIRPRRSPIALALVVALASFITLAAPARVAAWSSGTFSSASERELIALTNRSRASAGLRSLRVDSTLTSVARWRSKDMIDRDYFSHDIPGYGSVFKKLDSKGYCYRLAGENIGWNTYPDDQATAAIHQMFMDSAGHRENILGKAWEVIGVGAYKGADGKKMWTVLFADKCGSVGSAAKPKPAPKPAAQTAAKPKATPKPTPRPTPRPTGTATPAPTPTSEPGRLETDPEATPGGAPSDDPASDATAATGSLRVIDVPTSRGFVDTIVGGVTSLFFGG
jgi:uncharacterized protein YkwD